MAIDRWTKDQLKLAFHLYCQLPFGKLDQRNPDIIKLAGLIGRTPSAVAMKLVNFASLDPVIRASGRAGLSGASQLDREVWDEFNSDWERLSVEVGNLRRELTGSEPEYDYLPDEKVPEDHSGETRQVIIEKRIGQGFFRRSVLSSYRTRCCMSGVSDARLLVASHIVPWSRDKKNRLNPSNGLCLSAIHDRAFDGGLISLTDNCNILVSRDLHSSKDQFIQTVLVPLHGKQIEQPERFAPAMEFIVRHRNELFLDSH